MPEASTCPLQSERSASTTKRVARVGASATVQSYPRTGLSKSNRPVNPRSNHTVAEKRKTVGIIGLGIMGSAMSKNLLEAGFAVHGYDISASAAAAFTKAGGRAMKSVTEVAANVEIII